MLLLLLLFRSLSLPPSLSFSLAIALSLAKSVMVQFSSSCACNSIYSHGDQGKDSYLHSVRVDNRYKDNQCLPGFRTRKDSENKSSAVFGHLAYGFKKER